MMTRGVLEQLAQNVRDHGPTRVVINTDGVALSPRMAYVSAGVIAEVIFIRRDGWSLGAPRRLELTAELMWKDEWVGVVQLDRPGVIPYSSTKGIG